MKIKIRIVSFFLSIVLLGILQTAFAQITLPYEFQNKSEYSDNEIYIGLLGEFPNMGGVWMDMTNSQLKQQKYSDNTLQGPSWSVTADGKGKFANMFYKLSDIPNKTIHIPHGLFGCRIFISFKSPMYLYFHETGGYAGADLNNPNDPNDGIRWELVELTWGNAGLWTNTSRVDAYQYPMGLEVTGYSGGINGTYIQSYQNRLNQGGAYNVNGKIGELLPHQAILDLWEKNVSTEFYPCKIIKTHSMDSKPIIEQPSKISQFKENGESKDYFKTYIDDIWETYRHKDLFINIGDRGTWRGKVTGDRFDFYDPADNSQATIYWKPTTQDAIEGKGSLAYTIEPGGTSKYHEDLMMQAQICAAINRHAIYTNALDGEVQYNHDASRFFTKTPYNQYVKFFHDEQISYLSQTYAFAYDDVGDHSSTIQCTFPTLVKVTIGGFANQSTNVECNVVRQAYKPLTIPGLIEAENYDTACPNIAYFDSDATNNGGKYRNESVDIEKCNDVNGGYNVGWIQDKEWLEYTVEVATTGNYNFDFRTASESEGGVLHIEVDGELVSGNITLPVTADWQKWQNTTCKSIPLLKGKHTIRIFFDKGGFNFNSFSVSESLSYGFLHVDGKSIKTGTNANFLIKSIGTGNWMVQEGYMMQSTPVAPTQHEFREKLIATIGKEKTNEFYDIWLNNSMRKIDVDSMAAWGFNSIRVALHYEWFTLPIEQEPVLGQNTWLSKGFEMLDSLLHWCESNHMYLIIDMHAAPGGQGKNADISDYNPSKPSLWESIDNQNKLTALWTKIAQRYSNSQWVGGYELINETNWDFENSGNENGCSCSQNIPLITLQKRLIDAIRSVDKNHIVYVSGNCWGNNYSGMDNLFAYDNNLVITFHKYWNYNNINTISGIIALRNNNNKPLWLSESGENSNTWFTDAIHLLDSLNIGWSWWPVKKSGINNILKVTTNPDYQKLMDSWNGNGTITANEAYNAVLTFADNQRLEKCEIAYDVIDALIRQPHSILTKPYKNHTINKPISATNYDMGRNNYAYFDNVTANYHGSTSTFTAWNTGWAYRNDGVDIQACNDTLGNGYNIGWIQEKEWTTYTVNIPITGTYHCIIRSASTLDSKIHLEVNNTNISGSITLPATGDWQKWKSNTSAEFTLTAGTYPIKVYVESGSFNFNFFELQFESTQTIALQKGWNLISTNVHISDSTIETVFAGLDVQMVKNADGFWKKGQGAAFNSLQTITAGKAYLVNMNVAGTLTITGTPMSFSNFQIGTSSNWYMVGCPYQTPTPFSTKYNATNTQTIKNFDGFWEPNGTTNSISNFEPGKGYYVKK